MLRLRSKYRSEMGIMGDILAVTMNEGQNGVAVLALSRKANLSHFTAIDKCEKLINAGLIETRRDDRTHRFMMTEKGLKFFDEFKRFQNLLESMGLRP